jgi:hypothetical protein
MSLFLSTTDGNSWNGGRVLWHGASAYSTLALLTSVRAGTSQDVGVLYERGLSEARRYSNITLAVVPTI